MAKNKDLQKHDEPPQLPLEAYGDILPRSEIAVKLNGSASSLQFLRGGTKGDGKILPILANARIVLKHNPDLYNLCFDEFSQRVFCGTHEITDVDYINITDWVQHQGVHCDINTVVNAIRAIAQDCTFHQVRDYLTPLVWDKTPRLEQLFIDHGGAEDTPATRTMTRKWFIQAVARIYEPGCQADTMLILEGEQGLRKSTFFRHIAHPWFKDDLSDITKKDAKQELRGQWVVEMAELSAMDRTDVKHLKAFLTVKQDHYRDSYGRTATAYPRQCVFAGTVNPGGNGFLRDPTGARRFWIIEITEEIPIALINRDQLWAEAVALYLAKEAWYVEDQAIGAEIAQIQDAYYEGDVWEDAIAEYLVGRAEVTTAEVLTSAVKAADISKWGKGEQMRVGNILRRLGWVRTKSRLGAEVGTKKGAPRNVYVRASTIKGDDEVGTSEQVGTGGNRNT